MLTSTNLVSVVAVLLSLAGPFGSENRNQAHAYSQSQQRQPEVFYVDEMAPPKTLREMYAASALVVRATVEATGSPQPASRERPVAVRRQRVRVLEVFKEDDPLTTAGAELTVLQRGGTVNVDGREISTEYSAPLLQQAQEVILFLMRDNQPHTYVIAYGAAGLFAITDDSVVVPNLVQTGMKEFSGKSIAAASEFKANLRGMHAKH